MIRVGSTVGNYTVVSKLGEGAMAGVYLAEHPRIGKRVAIKVIHPELSTSQEMVSRFFTEARAASQVHHDNIVDIQDFGQTPDGDNFIIMEYLEGDTLASRLKSEGRFDVARAVRIGIYLCDGLAAAHAKGVIHRDLKPDNVFLVTRGTEPDFPKILDFGLAKLTGGPAQAAANHKTKTGSVLGTPHYMAPEQCEGKSQVDARTDIYSLGCMLYQVITGELPFPGDGFGEVLVKHLREPPPSARAKNPQVSPALDKVLLHSLAKKREYRFSTIQDLARALRDPERFSLDIGDDMRRIIGPMPGEPDPPPPGQQTAPPQAVMETLIGEFNRDMLAPPPPQPGQVVASAAPEQRTMIATAMPVTPQMAMSNFETVITGQNSPAYAVPQPPAGQNRSGRTLVAEAMPAPYQGGQGYDQGQAINQGFSQGQGVNQGLGYGQGYSAMPMPPEQRPFYKSPVFFGVMGGAALALGALVLVPVLSPRTYTVSINSTPPGAKVTIDGKPAGQTPYVIQRKKGEPALKVLLHKDGYTDWLRPLQPQKDETLSVRLLPKPVEPVEEGGDAPQGEPDQQPGKPAAPVAKPEKQPQVAKPEKQPPAVKQEKQQQPPAVKQEKKPPKPGKPGKPKGGGGGFSPF